MNGADESGKSDTKPDLGAMRTCEDGAVASPARRRRLQVGEVFAGRFQVQAFVGAGKSGDVYRALDTRLNRSIALKLICSNWLAGPGAQARFMQGVATARDIRHSNVVVVYDADTFEHQSFLTMEYLEGQNLRSWMREQFVLQADCPLETAIAIVSAILDGLEAAHALGITHRELKPENVFLLGTPGQGVVRLKLLDFGIAGAEAYSPGSFGPALYMAPEERLAPETTEASADLYSLSIIFYELLVGVQPQYRWQPPSEGRTDVPVAIDELIRKGLSFMPGLRPQNVEDYRVELGNGLGKTAAPTAPDAF